MATKKKSAKKGNDAVVAAEIGAGVLAAAGAAAAGYYYYGSKKAKSHRRKTAKWANDMKNTVVKEAKKQAKTVSKLDKQAMAVIVDRASKAYKGARNVRTEDLAAAANELKQNWAVIAAELTDAAKKSGAAVKKAGKTATRSVKKGSSKKTAKKALAKKSAKKSAKKTRPAAKKRK